MPAHRKNPEVVRVKTSINLPRYIKRHIDNIETSNSELITRALVSHLKIKQPKP